MAAPERYAVASAVGGTGTVHVWEGTDGSPRRVASGATIAGPGALATVYDGARLLALARSASGGTTIATYDTARASGGPAARCGAPETSLVCVTASHGHAFVAAGGGSGRIYLWAAGRGTLLAGVDAHLTAVTRLAFSPDDSQLLSAGEDGAVLAWDVAELVSLKRDRTRAARPCVTLRGHSLPVRSLAVGVGGASARVVSAAADRSLRVWHLGSQLAMGHVVLPCAPVEVCLTPDETHVFAGLEDGRVLVVHLPSLPSAAPTASTGMRAIPAPVGETATAVSAMCLGPGGREVIVGYADGLVRTYDAASLVLLRTYGKHVGGNPVTALAVLFPIPSTLRDGPVPAWKRGGQPVVDTAAVVGEWPALASAMLPMPTFAKLEHPGGDAEFSASVVCCSTKDPIAEAWGTIDAVAECEWSDDVEQGGQKQTGGVESGGVPVHVMKELEMLRRRNRELEEAGQRLCDALEGSGQFSP